MNDLEKSRREIDGIDRELRGLFLRRMEVSARIGAWKRENGLPVTDSAREAAVIEKNCAGFPDAALLPFYRDFLCENMRLSRAYQNEMTRDGGALHVFLGEDSYDIFLLRGARKQLTKFWNLSRKVLIVTDDGVPTDYVKSAASQCADALVLTLPQGEKSKTPALLAAVWRALLDGEFSRSDAVIAVGGGVVGDLSALAAATFMRGVDFYAMPTTLLSQLDSSIGGKCAVDLDGVKNSVGVFRQPKGVVIDPEVLATLPKRQIAAGMAEAVKVALTSDAELFRIFEAGEETDKVDEVILRALQIKKAVVEADPNENSARKILNFGHTLGHGIEAAEEGRLLHGECVALGMIPMCSAPVRARLLPVLQRLGLPTSYPGDLSHALEYTKHDKKRNGETLSLVTVAEIGHGEIVSRPFEEWKQEILQSGT